MKDFERFLRDLPKPDVEVPVFRERLRRELRRRSREAAPGRRHAIATWVLTGGLAAALALCVTVPEIPHRVHDLVFVQTGDPIAAPGIEGAVDPDLAFVEEWSARQDRPVGVRSIESERQFRVREFELSDGKRMLVFSEIEAAPPPKTAVTPSARQAARYF